MVRKKKEEVVEVPEVVEEVLKFEGEIQLDSSELYRLLYFDAKIKNLELTRRIKAREIDEQIRNIKQALEKFDKDIVAQKDQTYDEMNQVKAAVEENHKIKLSDYTLDELTGKLTKIPNPKEA